MAQNTGTLSFYNLFLKELFFIISFFFQTFLQFFQVLLMNKNQTHLVFKKCFFFLKVKNLYESQNIFTELFCFFSIAIFSTQNGGGESLCLKKYLSKICLH
ncbi:unnamed protein product [Caretta caretta]